MDILELLKKDHEKVNELFKKIEKTGNKAIKTKQKLLTEITTELKIHTKVEENLFYPKLKEFEETRSIIFESLEEHNLVDHLLEKIEDEDISSEAWSAKITVLKEIVNHHIKEEENELFPRVKKVLPTDDLLELANEVKKLKLKFKKEQK